MILVTSCSIKGCPHQVHVETTEYRMHTDFVLCQDCETSVILDCHLRMEQDDTNALPEGSTLAFAAVFNGWYRRRRGVSVAHKSGVARSLKDMRRELPN